MIESSIAQYDALVVGALFIMLLAGYIIFIGWIIYHTIRGWD